MLSKLLLTVPVVFGLESVVASEIRGLGYETTEVDDGRVTFAGDESAICTANINIRSGERVLIKMGEFTATSFDNLFEGVKAIPWENWITFDAQFPVKGHSIKSDLFSIPDCQKIIKRAIVERLKLKYNISWFEETSAKYQVQFAIKKNIVTMYIDTTGESLHKRGYRESGVIAPLRETLASAIINLTRWQGDRPFLDPMCGSGTIPIEAAMYALNIAPGIKRHFAAEKWSNISSDLWIEARKCANDKIKNNAKLEIMASDMDKSAIEQAMQNAKIAGVSDYIKFTCSKMQDLTPFTNKGAIVCNPPYGERLLDVKTCEKLYKDMGEKFSKYPLAGKYIITSYENFENIFGRKSDKKRKIYNGMIKCNLYQYFKVANGG